MAAPTRRLSATIQKFNPNWTDMNLAGCARQKRRPYLQRVPAGDKRRARGHPVPQVLPCRRTRRGRRRGCMGGRTPHSPIRRARPSRDAHARGGDAQGIVGEYFFRLVNHLEFLRRVAVGIGEIVEDRVVRDGMWKFGGAGFRPAIRRSVGPHRVVPRRRGIDR